METSKLRIYKKVLGFSKDVRKKNFKNASSFGVSHEEVSEHAIPGFCCWSIYETLRDQCPYCNITTFCMINWLQIAAESAKITGRKQVIK